MISTKNKWKIIFFYFILFTSVNLFSQVKIHKSISTEDGLIDNSVLRIIQDSYGYMWFATKNGISKWDGNKFTNLTTSNGLTSPAIIDLLESKDSTVYISNYRKGIVAYKEGIIDTINSLMGLSNDFVIRIRTHNGNPIFISDKVQEYKNGALNLIQSKADQFETRIGDIFFDENDKLYASSRYSGFYVFDDFADKIFTEDDGLISKEVDLFEKDINGNILIATFEGPNKYSKGKISPLKYNSEIINCIVTDIAAGKNGTNYFATNKGLIVEKNNSIEILTTENGLLDNSIFSVEEDNNGSIYIGYENNGVSIYHPDRFTNYVSKDKYSDLIVNSIIEDNNSNILLGTRNGLMILNKDEENYTRLNKTFSNNDISSLSKMQNGNILIGTKNGFNIWSNEKLITYQTRNKSYYQEIDDIAFSPDGDIIMAVRRLGLQIFTKDDQKEKRFIRNLYEINNSSKSQKIQPDENLVASKEKIKRERLKDGILTSITLENGLKNSWILDLHMTKDSTLIIGYHGNGISFYKNGIFKHLAKVDGLTDGIINTIFEHPDGSFWFGTSQGGICIYKNGFIDTLNIDDGLSSNDIRGIVNVDNLIYVTTSKGLNVIIPYPTGTLIRTVNKKDGLVSDDCNRNAVYVDKENNIWIGTNKGTTKYNSKADKQITSPPKIYLTDFEIYNEKYPIEILRKTKELNFDQNYLKFIFTGINLSAPDKILYKYRLIGVDRDWTLDKENSAKYTHLNKGDYTFEVKARNEWGYWSEPISLAFTINPAWWETWWFRLSVISAIGFLLWLAFQYRLNYLLKLERLRTKIASDLHDEVGSLLTQISINVDSLTYTKDEEKRKEKSNFIRGKSKEVINMMSDVIWSIDSRNDNMESLIDRIHNFAQNFIAQKNIVLNFSSDVEDKYKALKIDFRQNVMMIAKEAINNAVKYSGCSKIDVNIISKNNHFELSVKDNGKGFDIENVDRGNGLNNMTMRAELISAELEIKNKNGCLVKLTKNKL
ncbi:MAG: hypothetical protein H6612_04395 [Ignavibacteriales bacterium]|nr:hypothetical protein [Ignavibacteriales bacterium]